jgi:hypothetical protein
MVTEILPTNSADAVPVVRAALVVPEDPVELAVLVALVVPAVQEALVALESPAVPVALVVPAVREALVVSENPAVPVALELVPAEAGPVQDHRPAQLAVALRTKSGIAAHHPDLVPLLEAGEDLAAAVAETTREPAAAEVVIAWEAADTVAAAVVEDAAVAEEDAAVAAEDAEDNERR